MKIELPARPRRRIVSLVPMVDVVMNLLFFFMLATTYTQLKRVVLSLAGPVAVSTGTTAIPHLRVASDSLKLDGASLDWKRVLARLKAQRDPRVIVETGTGLAGTAAARRAGQAARSRRCRFTRTHGAVKIPLPPRRRSATEDMLPLINVVFLLILFFLMAGQIAPTIAAGATAQAVAVSGGGEAARTAAVILLDADGRLRWEGVSLTDAQLVPRAIGWSQRHPDVGIGVQADAQTSADRVVEVFSLLQGAGIGEVRLLAKPER